MTRLVLLFVCLVTAMAVSVSAPPVSANDDHDHDSDLSVTAGFGAGLNTAGGANNFIIPRRIKVKQGGLVHFQVAGRHQIIVFQLPAGGGKLRPEDVVPTAVGGLVNDVTNPILYTGQLRDDNVPPPPSLFSRARNRVESVFFALPGTYLVICNVLNHFDPAPLGVGFQMFAYVDVEEDKSLRGAAPTILEGTTAEEEVTEAPAQ